MDIAHRPPTARILQKLRTRRFWALFVLGVFASLISVVIAIRVDQALFRRDAERFLIAVGEMQVGTTTPAEARKLLNRWPQNLTIDGDCNRKCWVAGVLNDFVRRHNNFFIFHRPLLRLYMVLGGQLAEVRIQLEFVNGVFHSHSIGVYLYVAPYQDDHQGCCSEYTLIAAAYIFRERPRPGSVPLASDPLHPSYWVGPAPCDGCRLVKVTFAPEASSADVNRLMQFDLSCLNRWWHPCRSQSDIMPAAWQQFLQDATRR
jgi:hypothetical protein